MQNKLQQLKQQARQEIEQAENAADLEKLEIKYLGRKGEMSGLMRGLGELSAEERPKAGALANEVKKAIAEAVSIKRGQLKSGGSAQMDFLDVTAPGVKQPEGHLHLVSQAIKEISDIFAKIGFYRVQYPEVESDWYAFESLNMPPDHPARDEWETFFIDGGLRQAFSPSSGPRARRPEHPNQSIGSKLVLTPHTSSGQAREMFRRKPPIRMINIAKCYRRQIDVSHTPMFHQFEGLYIDKKVTIGHLKGVFDYFGEQYFGKGRVTRLRPSHFQFTEPSFEVDIKCGLCLGEGCKMCKEGWLELGGSGMVHPNVLKAGGVDPKKYNGFAFGWGVERTLMMKGGLKVDDIRILYKNDLRFLEQF